MASSVDDIESLWRTAVENFEKTSDIKFKGHGGDINEIKKHIADATDTGQENTGPQDKMKRSFDCLLDLGKTASDVVASTVFPPAAVCYQAVEFLVDTVDVYQKYYRVRSVKEVLESLLPILEDIEDILKLGKEGARVSLRLQRSIVKVLLGFIQICEVYAKIKKDAKSFIGTAKMVLKAFARYDSHISSHLHEIKGVVDLMRDIRIGEMHNHSLQSESERKRDARRNEIKQSLILDNPRLSNLPWSTAHTEHRQRFKLGTGAWLPGLAQFSMWANTEKHCTQPVVLFVAPEGHGKSHLVSEAIEYLQWKHESLEPNSRVTVAYFYFENPRRVQTKNGRGALGLTLYDALSAVLWQFAESDVACQNFVSRKAGNHSSMDLWKKLLDTFGPKHDTKKTLFVILDGVDQCAQSSEQSSKSQITELIKTIESLKQTNLQIRMLLSCKEDFLEGSESVVLSIVKLRQLNEDDVRIMVSSKLDSVCETWTNTSEIRKWREETQKTISTELAGDLVLLNHLFETIGKDAEMEEVDEIIHNQLINRSMITRYRLEKLEKTLNDKQIDVLNELLAWAIYMYRWPTIEELILVLRFRCGQKSVRSLEHQIKQFYSQVLEVENDIVTAWSVLYYFEDPRRTSPLSSDVGFSRSEDSSFTTSAPKNAITEPEISLVQDIVRNMFPDHLFEKFRFQQHFEQLRSQNSRGRNRRIVCSHKEAHETIASTCIQLIVANDNIIDQREALDEYTARYLLKHMNELQPDQFNPKQSQEVAKNLSSFFTDEIVIRRWLGAIKGLHYGSWFDNLDRCISWLEILDTDKKLDYRLSMDPLKASRKVLADHWLQKYEWQTREALHLVLTFYAKSQKLEYNERISKELILEAERLAIHERGMNTGEASSAIHHVRVAESLLLIDRKSDTEPDQGDGHVHDSIERCRLALKHDKKNWRAFWCMAQAEDMLSAADNENEDHGKNALEAISSLEETLLLREFRLENSNIWDSIVEKRWALYDRQNTPKSDQIAACEKLLGVYPDHRQATERFLSMISHVSELENRRTSFVSMLLNHADSQTVHQNFYQALQGNNAHYVQLKEAYSEALRQADTKPDIPFYLRYYYGLALFHHHLSGKQDFESSLSQWKVNADDDQKDKQSVMQIVDASIGRLVCSYISSAKSVARRLTGRESTTRHIELVRKLKSRKDRTIGHDIHFLTILLARLYFVSGQKDLARETIQNYIRFAVGLLSDDTEENDDQGFLMLNEAFVPLEDDTNAEAALTARLIYDDQAEEWDHYVCDGGCGRGWTRQSISDIWACRDCLDTGFDDQCYKQRESIISKYQICGQHHDYLHYPKELAERAKKTKRGSILVGGKEIRMNAWLDRIREEYLL